MRGIRRLIYRSLQLRALDAALRDFDLDPAGKDVLLVVSSAGYLPHARAALASAEKCAPKALKILVLVGGDARIQSPNVRVVPVKNRLSGEMERAFCANIRVNVIRRLLDLGVRRLVYVDADSLILRDPFGHFAEMEAGRDVGILLRDSEKDKWKCVTGVLFVRNGEASRRFLARWDEAVSKDIFTWYADQVGFAKCAESDGGRDVVHPLPRKYVDWTFFDDSVIWIRKGDHEQEQAKFRERASEFLKRSA